MFSKLKGRSISMNSLTSAWAHSSRTPFFPILDHLTQKWAHRTDSIRVRIGARCNFRPHQNQNKGLQQFQIGQPLDLNLYSPKTVDLFSSYIFLFFFAYALLCSSDFIGSL